MFINTLYSNIFFQIANHHTYMQIINALNAHEKILPGNWDTDASYPDADPNAT